jgi:hypothetical protein
MFEAFYAGKGEMESVYVEVYKFGKLIGCVLADEVLLFSPFSSAIASYSYLFPYLSIRSYRSMRCGPDFGLGHSADPSTLEITSGSIFSSSSTSQTTFSFQAPELSVSGHPALPVRNFYD